MLVELGLVEQRYKAVCEVLDGATIIDVAERNGVTRQTVHSWLRRYASSGLAGLVDKSSKPESCPHQMAPVVEARIVEMRRAHPGWGPRSIRTHLAREGVGHCRAGLRSIGPWSVTACSSPRRASGPGRTTSDGSGRSPWSSGRWTSSAGSIWSTAPR